MAFDIADFKGHINKKGVLQTNKFDVLISFPYNPKGFGNLNITSADGNGIGSTKDNTRDLQYRCIGASLPGIALRTADVNRFGIGISEKMPFTGNYTDVTLTFLMDRTGDVYKFWYTWINYIFGTNGQEGSNNIYGQNVGNDNTNRSFYTAEYKDNYAADVTVTIYDATGKAQIVATLVKAFPISINDIALNWSDNNNLIKLTTTVTFREWVFGSPEKPLTLKPIQFDTNSPF
jgi:hypothetical protein